MPSPEYELEHAPTIRGDRDSSTPTQATRLEVKNSHRADKQERARSKPKTTASLANAFDVKHDVLAALEIESRLPKGLLSDKLRSENKELRDMLRRFG